MRISTKGRYSLEALLYMALLPTGEYTSTRVIAENTGISEGYLEQLFIPLRKAGIVQGFRGPQGGYVPGRDPDKITAGDILRAVEGSLEPVECISVNACPLRDTCGSRQTWVELYDEISACVDSLTLQDLVRAYQTMDQVEYTI
ncbi:MAG: Rrf2 family transcriptional regulator [Treponema sp.]|jgi:Rrf2 family protein|nr:Rrf2 family transcriptional regulator [Treponema sp.]